MMLQIHFAIERLKESLARLDLEKESLLGDLRDLENKLLAAKPPDYSPAPTVSPTPSQLTPDEKIEIFMGLFRGRMDVFPKRWENTKTGKSGYSPSCQNEWARGVCRKPQIKCSQCLNQAYTPVTSQVIRKHLVGENIGAQTRDHTIGITPDVLLYKAESLKLQWESMQEIESGNGEYLVFP